jgi:tRNA nucleotidyltransferase (CCA-adding enzyme)
LRLDGHHYGELYDYWGGLRDLRQGLVRVLHSLSFVDDPTRQLRAVRFEQRFQFQIDGRTLQLMDEAISLIKNVSGDRLRHELNLILQEERSIAMLSRLESLGLLAAIHPDLRAPTGTYAELLPSLGFDPIEDKWRIPEKVANLPVRLALAYLIWLLPFGSETVRQVADRLRLPETLHVHLQDAIRLIDDLPGLTTASASQMTFRLDTVPPLSLFAVSQLTSDPLALSQIEMYLRSWRNIWPSITGDDLRQMDIPPGPLYRAVLTGLRAAWLDGLVHDPEEEKILLQRLLAENT